MTNDRTQPLVDRHLNLPVDNDLNITLTLKVSQKENGGFHELTKVDVFKLESDGLRRATQAGCVVGLDSSD